MRRVSTFIIGLSTRSHKTAASVYAHVVLKRAELAIYRREKWYEAVAVPAPHLMTTGCIRYAPNVSRASGVHIGDDRKPFNQGAPSRAHTVVRMPRAVAHSGREKVRNNPFAHGDQLSASR